MQSNEEKLAKTMPNAPYTVEQIRSFRKLANQTGIYHISIYHLQAFDDFLSKNNGEWTLPTKMLKMLSNLLAPENIEFLEKDEAHFYQSLCDLIVDLQMFHQQKANLALGGDIKSIAGM